MELEEHSRSLRCGSETRIQSASYASMVYQPRRGADPYGPPWFYGKKVSGELDETVLSLRARSSLVKGEKLFRREVLLDADKYLIELRTSDLKAK
ncbi:jg20648 [Pararge aegeria aegeria]|uniref:Jg20648 protein n=1 Tax=Pararge aegeria aegeria TaxID=348720 RepID=A0A8S4RD93_9NEOP|nr:jg20648 [Pararge aegeria aegeria]